MVKEQLACQQKHLKAVDSAREELPRAASTVPRELDVAHEDIDMHTRDPK